MGHIGYIDLILITVIVLFGFMGYRRGVIIEVANVVGILFGVFFASRFAPHIGQWFSAQVYNFHSPSVSNLIGFVIILSVIWVLFLAIGIVVSKFIQLSDFIIIDKALGFIFACCKAFLVIAFMLYAVFHLEFMKSFNNKMIQNSEVYGMMKTIASVIIKIPTVEEAKNNLKNITQHTIDSAKEKLPETIKNIQSGINTVGKTVGEEITTQNTQRK